MFFTHPVILWETNLQDGHYSLVIVIVLIFAQTSSVFTISLYCDVKTYNKSISNQSIVTAIKNSNKSFILLNHQFINESLSQPLTPIIQEIKAIGFSNQTLFNDLQLKPKQEF